VSKKKHKKSLTADTPSAPQPQINNSLSSLVTDLGYDFFGGSQMSQTDTLFKNNRWYMISNMRQLLSHLYVEHGLIQTLIDQPVDDGFRGGITINSDQINEEEIETLHEYIRSKNIVQIICQAFKWNRLYGGAGVMILTGQDSEKPFNGLKQDEPFSLRAVDMWELFYNKQNTAGAYQDVTPYPDDGDSEFNYYNHRVHSSRVLLLKGKEAPSFIRPLLRGWGMSEVERLIRSFNAYLKNHEVIFELLDEAKIDVYKIEGFNSSMGTAAGTTSVQNRVQLSNQLKNMLSALVMDTTDDYVQKQMAFSGLGEMLTQIRMGVASDFKFPMTKLFGISASGFNSGEDDIENYNSMIDGEVRSKAEPIIVKTVQIICQHLFGISPDDITVDFKPLRVLSETDEEEVKNKKFDRFSVMYSQGLFTDKEYSDLLKKHDLLDIETEVMAGTREAVPPQPPADFQTTKPTE